MFRAVPPRLFNGHDPRKCLILAQLSPLVRSTLMDSRDIRHFTRCPSVGYQTSLVLFLNTFNSASRLQTHSSVVFDQSSQTPKSAAMSTPSKNTQKAHSHTPIEAAFNASTASVAEMKDQEDHAARVRQIQLEYEQTNASASASFGHSTETHEELPRTPPPRHLTAARAQAEVSYNNTTHPGQPERSSTASRAELTSHEEQAAKVRQVEHSYNQQNASTNASVGQPQETLSHPPHQPSQRDPDEYLQMFARASELLPELYCTCRRPETDKMIHCSSEKNCPVGWYHAACIGMKVLPGPNSELEVSIVFNQQWVVANVVITAVRRLVLPPLPRARNRQASRRGGPPPHHPNQGKTRPVESNGMHRRAEGGGRTQGARGGEGAEGVRGGRQTAG